MAGTERLMDFPVKASPVAADIVYVGDSADSFEEVQCTIGQIFAGYSAALVSIAGLTTSANQMIYTTGSDTYATASLTPFGRSLLDDSTASEARTTLGLVIGTNVQAYSDALTSIAGLTTAADKMIYATASNTYATTDLTSFARTLLDDANAAAAAVTLAVLPLSGGTMSGAINMGSQSITNLASPSAATDAVNKSYVDNAVQNIHAPAVVATTGNLVGYTYSNGSSGVGATLTAGSNGAFSADGVSPALNSRILVAQQSTTFQNGMYTLTQVGNAGAPAILTRATDYDQPADIQAGDTFTILQGTLYGGTEWIETATVTTIGTDPITFTQLVNNAYLVKANNLSDVASASTSATNLGLGTASNVQHAKIGIGAAPGTDVILAQGAIRAAAASANFSAGAEACLMDFTGTVARIGHIPGASGSAKPLEFMSNGVTYMSLSGAGALSGTTIAGSWVAAQSDYESDSTTTLIATPGRLKYSPGVVKAWIRFDGSSSGFLRGYNVSSLTDGGVGVWTINFTVAFSDTNYCAVLNGQNAATTPPIDWRATGSVNVGSFGISMWNNATNALTDTTFTCAMFTGDF
jgi:hypothetical protein